MVTVRIAHLVLLGRIALSEPLLHKFVRLGWYVRLNHLLVQLDLIVQLDPLLRILAKLAPTAQLRPPRCSALPTPTHALVQLHCQIAQKSATVDISCQG